MTRRVLHRPLRSAPLPLTLLPPPHRHSKRLHELATKALTTRFGKAVKDLVAYHLVPDGTHNDTWHKGGRAYYSAMLRWFEAVDKYRMVPSRRPSGGGGGDGDMNGKAKHEAKAKAGGAGKADSDRNEL